MAEYAGYVPNQAPANFGKVASDFASDLISIKEQARKEEMELAQLGYKTKKEQEKEFNEDLSKFPKVEKTVGQSYNQLITKSLRTIADVYAAYNKKHQKGEVSATELSLLKNSLMDTQNGLAAASKKFNEGASIISKESQKQSKIGSVMNRMYADAGDFTNKELLIDNKGNGFFMTKDKEGNITPDYTPISPGSIADANNFMDYGVDYTKAFNEAVKGIGEVEKEVGNITTKSAKDNPLYKQAVNGYIQKFTAYPKDVARVLTELGDYAPYSSENEKQSLIQQGYAPDKLIKISIGKGGLPEPIVDEKHKEEAQKIVSQQIEQRISTSRKLDEERRININTGEKKPTESEKTRMGLLEDSRYIFNDFKFGGKMSEGAGFLKELARDLGYENVVIKNVVDKKRKSIPGKIAISYDDDGTPVQKILRNEFDVFKLLYPGNKKKALTEYNLAKEKSGENVEKRTPQTVIQSAPKPAQPIKSGGKIWEPITLK